MRVVTFLMFIIIGQYALADTLTLEKCISEAMVQHPMENQRELNREMNEWVLKQNKTMNLPFLTVSGQVSYQSDVVEFPDNPVIGITIPKFQSRVYLDAQQVLYNGKLAEKKGQLDAGNTEVQNLQIEIELQKTREIITDLYFGLLIQKKQTDLLNEMLAMLKRQKKQLTTGIENGLILPSAADKLELEILKIEGELTDVSFDQTQLHQLLDTWTGLKTSDYVLLPPDLRESTAEIDRPELELIDRGIENLSLASKLESNSKTPVLAAFLQAGFGSPNPLNFFETDFQPYYLAGIRANWTIFDFGKLESKQKINLLSAQKMTYQQLHVRNMYERQRSVKYSEMENMEVRQVQDRKAVVLQQRIVDSAQSQFNNGVITTSEYLSEMDRLNSLKLQVELRKLLQIKNSWDAAMISGQN